MTAIRFGIWGAGAVAHDVAADFQLVAGAVLHAVAARNGDKARALAVRFGVHRSGEGIAALLEDPEVDVVYVATPSARHAQDCLECIEAGKAVLCEKPFALNAKQAEQVIDAARSRGVFCMEAMWTRFIPAVQAARALIARGALGPVRLIQGNFAYPSAPDSRARLLDPALGGGALLDRGVYLISLAQHFLGSPQSVNGRAMLTTTGVDQQSAYQLGFADGAIADLSASLVAQGSNEVVFCGERGWLRLCDPFYRAHRFEVHAAQVRGDAKLLAPDPFARLKAALRKLPAMKGLRRKLDPLFGRVGEIYAAPFPGNGYQFELAEVVRCLRAGLRESPTMPLADTLNVVRTMDQLRNQWDL